MIESKDLVERYFGGVHPEGSSYQDRPPIFFVTDEIKQPDLDKIRMTKFETPGLDGYIIVPRTFERHINKNPATHNNGSEARYIIDGHVMENGHALFLSLLDVNGLTSHHHHQEPLSEDYWILKGEAEIGGKKAEKYLHTPSNTDHQVKAIGSGILFMAQLRHAGGIPRELWHQPIDK